MSLVKSINHRAVRIGLVALGSTLLVGCNVGNAPPPMSDQDVKAQIDALSPQKQMDFISNSNMPASEKIKQIQAVEAKTGVKDSKPYPVDGHSGGFQGGQG